MKSICFYFRIHQPFRLKRYRFFDIGNDHYYYDDFADDEIITRVANQSYIPMAKTLLDMIKTYGNDFKFSFSISGTAIEQLQLYVPEFIDLLKQLAETRNVEFLSGTYSHSLAALEDPEEFMREVKDHDRLLKQLFNVTPKTFMDTELIFDDDIATLVQAMGFKSCLTEGAKHILGWKSPDYIYTSATAPNLKLLLTNAKFAKDITRNFANTEWSEYPLTADKYMNWIAALPEEEQVLNLNLSMEAFGGFIPASTGIFEFLKALPRFAKEHGISFDLPSEVVKKMKPVGELSIPYPISGVDEARDVSAWRGNDLQKEALSKLYSVAERVNLTNDRRLKQDWKYLQSADHFFYMSTKNMADGESHAAFSPYDSPFSAFTNYMNVLADFMVRVREQFPEDIDNEELNSLLLTIGNQAQEIESLNKEVKNLRANIINADDSVHAPVVIEGTVEEVKPKTAKKAATKKAPAKKSESKKTATKK